MCDIRGATCISGAVIPMRISTTSFVSMPLYRNGNSNVFLYLSDMFPFFNIWHLPDKNANALKRRGILSGALSVYLTAAQYIDFYYLKYKDYILKD